LLRGRGSDNSMPSRVVVFADSFSPSPGQGRAMPAISRLFSPRRRAVGLNLEHLEARDCPAVNVLLDYRYDNTNWFTPARRAAMDLACSTVTARFNDSLAAITPGGGNSWTAQISNVAGNEVDVPNLA